MTIQFYLNNEEETHIYSLYDMSSNPFKIGDVINLSVDDIPPVKLKEYKPEFAKKLVEDNKQQRAMFHNKKIKIIHEWKYIDIESDRFTIEYHCDLVS
jgi:hypothetical protein